MSDYTEFFLKSAAKVKLLDLLEISHPDFTQTYYIVRNAAAGVTVTLETDASQTFAYYPVGLKGIALNQTLDQALEVQLGDLGEVLPQELDAIATAGTFSTKPLCIYRGYRSDDLTAPLNGPIKLEIANIAFNSSGCSFTATAPTANANKTGEQYTLDRFPMLKGFLL